MQEIAFLFRTFFTHKDFLPAAGGVPGTIYTPLHWVVSAVLLIAVILLAVWVGRKGDERLVRRIMLGIWICAIVWEPTKILWESFCGKEVSLEVGGVLPFYPCSVFMLALPLCIWGNRTLRFAGCGIAVANASPACMAAADHVTKAHDAHGVAHGIFEILKI